MLQHPITEVLPAPTTTQERVEAAWGAVIAERKNDGRDYRRYFNEMVFGVNFESDKKFNRAELYHDPRKGLGFRTKYLKDNKKAVTAEHSFDPDKRGISFFENTSEPESDKLYGTKEIETFTKKFYSNKAPKDSKQKVEFLSRADFLAGSEGKPQEEIMRLSGKQGWRFSKGSLEYALATEMKITFLLGTGNNPSNSLEPNDTGIINLEEILDDSIYSIPRPENYYKVTSHELRHIKKHWDRFRGKVKFMYNGKDYTNDPYVIAHFPQTLDTPVGSPDPETRFNRCCNIT